MFMKTVVLMPIAHFSVKMVIWQAFPMTMAMRHGWYEDDYEDKDKDKDEDDEMASLSHDPDRETWSPA